MNPTATIHFRQGDVLIERVTAIPKTAMKQTQSAQIILAHGEATGHHHALKTESPVEWFEFGDVSSASHQIGTLAGELYVLLPTGGVVDHPEHSAIHLPAGNYRITRQREYSLAAIRNVAD